MVATDGSSGGSRAVDMAIDLAKALAYDLLIVTVADRLLGEEVRQLPHNGATAGDLLEALTGQTLRAAEARAREHGLSRIEVQTCWGDVTQCLINLVSSRSTRMLVVGRRGRGQLAGLLLGSVSQKLVSLAPFVVP
ncbi:UspA family protein [Bradyrhizobium sp. CCBAU 51745]|uniref:universal stress protein n=1 Tax=Bradyrhizobium sp. CCBAU 51745 TaxID=1325099 RepID=UPI0023051135|nr:universal stress protein [Bradyrhizobium sp. CCBAU 51745]MDA9440209.1 UspA family protein [Bradyrhizobium sp. CCBAU 51745]